MNKVYLINEQQMQALVDLLCSLNRGLTYPHSGKIVKIIDGLGGLDYIKADDMWCEVVSTITNLMKREL